MTPSYSSNVNFNNVTKQIVYTDTTDYTGFTVDSMSVSIIDPVGAVYTKSDMTTGSNTYTFSPSLDSDGEIIRGIYNITQLAVGAGTDGQRVSNINFNYVQPTIDLGLTVNCIIPKLSSKDNTNYTVNGENPSTATYAHKIEYPQTTEAADVTGTGQLLETGTFYTIKNIGLQHSSTIVSTVAWTFNGWSVNDVLTGDAYVDVFCDNDLCDVYCCMRSHWQAWINAKCKSKTEYEKQGDILAKLIINVTLLKQAMECGKGDDISKYVEQIKTIGNCSGDCGCEDGAPILVTGLGGAISGGTPVDTTTTVVSGDARIIVSNNTIGTNTTATISLDGNFSADNIPLVDVGGLFTATEVEAALAELAAKIVALQTLSGVSSGSTNLGTFTGATIPDNLTVKAAFQAIETAIESGSIGGANLVAVPAPSIVTITSDTGTDAVIPLTDGTNAGLFSPTEKTKLGNVTATTPVNLDLLNSYVKKSNFTATASPSITDDSSAGYAVGSKWVDVTNDNVFELVDSTIGAAIWKKTNTEANLGFVPSATSGTVTSSSGVSAVLSVATNTNGGLMSAADKIKADYVSINQSFDADFVGTNVKKNKYDGTVAPTTSNDSTQGYSVASIWVDVVANTAYICVDASVGAALWDEAGGGGGGGGVTNLAYTASPTNGIVTSDTGTDATLTLATTVNAGLLEPADKVKINTIIQNEYNAGVDPTVSDDNTQGYEVGSLWVNTSNNKAYVAVDVSTGAAIWDQTNAVGGGATNLSVTSITSTGLTVASDTGTDAAIPAATTSDAGLLVAADKVKINTILFNKLDGTAAPTTGDDSADGYTVGSVWIDTTNDKFYVCVDSTIGAAVWKIGSVTALGDLSDVVTAGAVTDDVLSFDGSDWIAAPLPGYWLTQAYTTVTYGATTTIAVSLAGAGVNRKLTLTGNTVIAITGAVNGMTGELIVTQDATGGRQITGLPATSVIVESTTLPNLLSPGANDVTILSWRYDGTTFFWDYGKNFG